MQPLFRLYKEFNSQQSEISWSEFQIATFATFLPGAATTPSPGQSAGVDAFSHATL